MRIPSSQSRREMRINMTPMIDVVFLLIIFFMVATKFTELERNIDLEVPQVAAAGDTQSPPQPRTVAVERPFFSCSCSSGRLGPA